jgi:hypothetical protein
MPNWCNNSITIKGPVEKIRALWAAANSKEDSGLLEAMKPMPNEMLEDERWYGWCVNNWGTKWDISNEGLEFNDTGDGTGWITGWADSAWAPPTNAFQTWADANEDCELELKYFEPGIGFVGVWDSEGGDAYWEDVGDLLETTPEEDPVLYDLLEHFNVWDWYESDEDIDIDAEEDL